MTHRFQVFTSAVLLVFCFFTPDILYAQQTKEPELVYVDKQGVLRWKKDHREAAFFGVNYTVPFAYGYRSVKRRKIDPEKAIDQDVYHLARLDFDAFRVHVWDTEISDTLGNLLENEHLRLFDYLIYRLKQRQIRVMLTPIAFWGNGYPEKDEKTPGFSHLYGKSRALVNESAFKAQENYLRQLLQHVNPYTKLTYGADANIIGAEINNEPHHSGPKARTTEYVNRMVAAVRQTGWTKPVFYNISESPRYADAVAKANVDGFSFQWYPTGLVANHTLTGNYLPHVDRYHIPFDTIPQFAHKALMVYEFDAGDILSSYMYPAMAKSFRTAGFQWATQFAYDPLATAYANTEYQTHFVNLAYTPSKAISLLIAGKVFHRLPLRKSYGTYPTDSIFDAFRVSYKESLSEMNTPQEFYYSNPTRTKPVNAAKLMHLAGVGSSPVVQYQGTGAYFLDKLEKGVWRLEVMPDAIFVSDPFAKASPSKEVSRLQWQTQPIQINLPDLGATYFIRAVNEGHNFTAQAQTGSFRVQPGTYLLSRKKQTTWNGNSPMGTLQVKEFVAPPPFAIKPMVVHQPVPALSAGKAFNIQALIAGLTPTARVALQINNLSGVYKTINMENTGAYVYQAQVPAELATPGQVSYRIMLQQDEKHITFPGAYEGDPWAWDYYHTDSWQTLVAPEKGRLELFDAAKDRTLYVYPNLWKNDERQLLPGEIPGQFGLKLTAKELPAEQTMGFQHVIKDNLKGRAAEIPDFDKLLVRMRTASSTPIQVKVSLITEQAAAYATTIQVDQTFRDIEIPLGTLKPDAFMLLPRPYPGFQPFWFKPSKADVFSLNQADKLQITLTKNTNPSLSDQNFTFEVVSVWLEKK